MALRAAQMASNPRNTCTTAILILLGRILNLNCQPDISAMTLLMGRTDRWFTLPRAPHLVCSKKSYGLFWHVQSSSELESWQCDAMGVQGWPWPWSALQIPSQLAEQWTVCFLPPLSTPFLPWQCLAWGRAGTGQVAGSLLSLCLMQLVSTYGECFCMVCLHLRGRPFHPSLVWCRAPGLVHIRG